MLSWLERLLASRPMKTIRAEDEVDWQTVVDELALDAEPGDSSDEPTVSMSRKRLERGTE